MPKSQKSAPKRAKQARNLAELPSEADPKAPFEIKLFLRAIAPVLRRLETDLLARASASESVRERLEGEHKRQVDAQRTADAYPQWVQAFVEQVAAAWVLACVFVRTLEDRGLLKQNRLAGPGAGDSLREFLSLAPSLSERDYIELCLRELLHQPAAEALFGAQNPLWLLAPSAEGARGLLEVFQAPNADAPALRFGQADTRFLGDLYQDLNENVRARYALLQTPKFVEDYILDRTLEPAIERFGLDHTTLIDPTCGSGHFLLGAFERLYVRHQRAAPNELATVIGERAIKQVAGTDINPYAVLITRFRLTLAYLEQTGLGRLSEMRRITLNVVVADSLLHSARADGVDKANGNGERRWFCLEDEPAAREVLNQQPKFTAVVGNPPYITVKDAARRDLYRQAYASAFREYSLGVPFTERFFDLARSDGRVGMITANSFMKREFGRKLISDVLPTVDLDFIVNSAGAYIPGHGTPTVLLFGTQRPPREATVLSVLGKRGEPVTPADASQGLVWSSIREHGESVGYDDDYISVAKIDRAKLAEHPWSLAGGGADQLKELLEERATKRLGDVVDSVGFMCITKQDEVFSQPVGVLKRWGISRNWIRSFVIGEHVRDWAIDSDDEVVFPYGESGELKVLTNSSGSPYRALWPWRTDLANRAVFGGKTFRSAGRKWWEYGQIPKDRIRGSAITFAEVATHNHFVLDRGGKVFKQTAPIIKLPEGATEDDHLALLAYLNSSTACFYFRQVLHCKGAQGVNEGHKAEEWEQFLAFSCTQVATIPLPHAWKSLRSYGQRLARLAEQRASVDPLADDAPLKDETLLREMVGLQESLDYEVYRLFGLLEAVPECKRQAPGSRPFERALVQAGQRTAWFTRHGYAVPEAPLDARIPESVRLLEQPIYKRRWLLRDWRALRRAAAGERALTEVERAMSRGESVKTMRAIDKHVVETEEGAVPQLVAHVAIPFLAAHRYTDSGFAKYRQWQAAWALQRREDAGEKVARIPVPPRYESKDFRKPEYWRLRGKLDVPKERFISYPGLESDEDHVPLYGWAGWDHAQRARALVELYNDRKDNEGWPTARLVPALAGLNELLPWVQQWHNEPDSAYDGARFGDDLAAFLAEELRSHSLTEADLHKWPSDRAGQKQSGKIASRPPASSKVPASLRKSEPANDNTRAKPRKKGAAK